MFKKNDNTSTAPNGGDSINLIGTGTIIKGDINANGDVRIDGTLTGTINAKGRLILGPQGVIEGNVFCKTADVSGTIKGNLTVAELTHLKATAKYTGDLTTNKLAIDPGAAFTGNCQMGGTVNLNTLNGIPKQQPKPAEEKVA